MCRFWPQLMHCEERCIFPSACRIPSCFGRFKMGCSFAGRNCTFRVEFSPQWRLKVEASLIPAVEEELVFSLATTEVATNEHSANFRTFLRFWAWHSVGWWLTDPPRLQVLKGLSWVFTGVPGFLIHSWQNMSFAVMKGRKSLENRVSKILDPETKRRL